MPDIIEVELKRNGRETEKYTVRTENRVSWPTQEEVEELIQADDLYEELQNVDGIGESRAEELDETYSSFEELKTAIHNGDDLDLPDEVRENLKEHLEG